MDEFIKEEGGNIIITMPLNTPDKFIFIKDHLIKFALIKFEMNQTLAATFLNISKKTIYGVIKISPMLCELIKTQRERWRPNKPMVKYEWNDKN